MGRQAQILDRIAAELANREETDGHSKGEFKQLLDRHAKPGMHPQEVVERAVDDLRVKTVLTEGQIRKIAEQTCSQVQHSGSEGVGMYVDGDYESDTEAWFKG